VRVLVLGGTHFLGRHIVDALLARGHEPVLFNRGKTNPGLFPEVERITGERETGLAALEGKTFDAVIDTSGYLPRVVRASAHALRLTAGLYCFISSVSVYDLAIGNTREDAPLLTLPEGADPDTFLIENYGPLKALCERAAAEAFGIDRTLVIRPGLIVGPDDPTDRFTYWPERIARGGDVLAPSTPEFMTQFIDVRDLASWTVEMIERNAHGAYNATSEDGTMRLGEVLEACKRLSGSDARLTWVDDAFLVANGVEGWMDLPLWIPGTSEFSSLLHADASKALAAGLHIRSIDDTVAATLAWLPSRDAAREWKTGLPPERERELLASWKALV
jgi:2'-hydroxyisoflavone reductase